MGVWRPSGLQPGFDPVFLCPRLGGGDISMIGGQGFVAELCGFWPERRVYSGAQIAESGGWSAEKARDALAAYRLETKSEVLPGDDLRGMLNQMTAEMREQFAAFVELRKGAEIAAGDGDEAAGKLARADLKAAVDAMGLIVRTLEKIDQLQRQLSRDREIEIESREQAEGYQAAKGQLLEIIEQRAAEKAELIVAARVKALQAGGEANRDDGISAARTEDIGALGPAETPGGGEAGEGGDGGGAVGGRAPAARAGGIRRGP